MKLFALLPVVFAGVYLVTLGAVALAAPRSAAQFLSGFASSAKAHFLELFVRFVVGAALISSAPGMMLPHLFSLLGWILVVTTFGLLVVPWRWHQRLAAWSVPQATRHMNFLGLGSFGGGMFLLMSAVPGPGLEGFRAAVES